MTQAKGGRGLPPLFVPPSDREAPLLVACSGGADSLGLLHMLLAHGCRRLRVAHFDHGLRAESAGEARWLREQVAGLGLPWREERWLGGNPGGNLHARARAARYSFLLLAAAEWGAGQVATGHHRDDQAETFLDRVMRGSGVRGLAAMAPERALSGGVRLLRPLLGVGRREIEEWLAARGISWLEDPSNRDPHYLRSRIRHGVMPALREAFPADPGAMLAGAAWHMRRAEAALEWALDQAWPALGGMFFPTEAVFPRAALCALPEELMARAVGRIHCRLTGEDGPLSRRALEGVASQLAKGRRRWRMRVRGMEIVREKNEIRFIAAPAALSSGRAEPNR